MASKVKLVAEAEKKQEEDDSRKRRRSHQSYSNEDSQVADNISVYYCRPVQHYEDLGVLCRGPPRLE